MSEEPFDEEEFAEWEGHLKEAGVLSSMAYFGARGIWAVSDACPFFSKPKKLAHIGGITVEKAKLLVAVIEECASNSASPQSCSKRRCAKKSKGSRTDERLPVLESETTERKKKSKRPRVKHEIVDVSSPSVDLKPLPASPVSVHNSAAEQFAEDSRNAFDHVEDDECDDSMQTHPGEDSRHELDGVPMSALPMPVASSSHSSATIRKRKRSELRDTDTEHIVNNEEEDSDSETETEEESGDDAKEYMSEKKKKKKTPSLSSTNAPSKKRMKTNSGVVCEKWQEKEKYDYSDWNLQNALDRLNAEEKERKSDYVAIDFMAMPATFECIVPKCNQMFFLESELERHKRKFHETQPQLKCPAVAGCEDGPFRHEETLEKHLRCCHPDFAQPTDETEETKSSEKKD